MSGADVLIHDAQYTDEEYPLHVGWGHSAVGHALTVAGVAGVGRLVAFHHDPNHNDGQLDRMYSRIVEGGDLPFGLIPAMEGTALTLGRQANPVEAL